MRELTLEEIELVAGGQETSDGGYDGGDGGDAGDGSDGGGDDGDVVVTGNPGDDWDDSDAGDGIDDQGDGGSDGGNNDGGDPPPQHTPDCTANHIGDQIKKDIGDNKSPEEWSAFIYKDPNTGEIVRSNVIGGPMYQAADYDLKAYGIPDGAVLEGYEHNHPTFNADGQVLTDRALADNGDLNALQNAGGYAVPDHKVTVDVDNFASYIMHDTKTDGSGYVVDKYTHAETVGGDYSGQATHTRPEVKPVSTSDLNNPSC